MVAKVCRSEERVELDEEVERASGDDAYGHAHHPHGRGQEDRAADDREVVDDRGQDGRHEPPARLQDARGDRSERQEDRAEEHDARQVHGRGGLRGVEAGRDRGHHGRREDQEEPGQDREPGEHQVRDR